jgi:hypothetical protein
MFRTRAMVLTQNFTATNLRLRWTARDGRLMARWEREPHDPTEQDR